MKTTKSNQTGRLKISDMTYIAVGMVLIAVCSWISIPAAVPFTLQTFAVFTVAGIIGGKRGFISMLVYILLGMAGIPVFSGGTAGIGVLLGSTGGYIIGFLGSMLVMWAAERIFGKGLAVQVISMISGLLVCYAFGTIWFMAVYAQSNGEAGLAAVLGWCVIPFIIPDAVKIALAVVISRRVRKYVL